MNGIYKRIALALLAVLAIAGAAYAAFPAYAPVADTPGIAWVSTGADRAALVCKDASGATIGTYLECITPDAGGAYCILRNASACPPYLPRTSGGAVLQILDGAGQPIN